MKRQGQFIFYVLIAAFSLSGCVRISSGNSSSLPEVSKIIAAPTSYEHILLSTFDASSSEGNIVVFDNEQRSTALASYLSTVDLFDNFTGSLRSDLLPDLSGENILSVCDNGNAPYSDFVDDKIALRTATVKSVITSIDTVAASKLTILSSPFMAAYGISDVDTLLTATSSAFPVICPILLAAGLAKDASFVCIVADEEASTNGIYEAIFGKDRIHIMRLDESLAMEDIFVEYDLIIVDDYSIAPGIIKNNKIKVVDTRELAAREVYRLMRERNTFTHAVSYPSKSALRTDFRGDYSLYDVQD